MARKKKCRQIEMLPGVSFFKPAGIPARDLEIIDIDIDEYEAIRLADREGMYQENAASKMNISRQTFGRIVESAHKKIAIAITEGKGLRIETIDEISIAGKQEQKITEKINRMKKIAIPTNGTGVDDHFGHCQYYTIYTMSDDNNVESRELLASPTGCGCKSDIAQLLADMGVKVILAGNMGEGAFNKLSTAGLEVYRGFSGKVELALNSFLNGYMGEKRTCEASHNHQHNDEGHSCNR